LARYNEVLKKHKNDDSLRYAVVVAAIAAEDYTLANKAHTQLSDRFKASLNGRLLQSEIAMKQQDYSSAAKSLAQLQKLYPDNQAIRYLYAECMIHLHQPAKAVRNYEYLVNNQPNDSRAWYLLAEAYGLNGDIVGVHDARIEFFLLTANIDKAMTQIEYALKEPGLTNQDKARFKQRKEEALQIRKSLEMDF
jgi:predicted Zn-dependent protease